MATPIMPVVDFKATQYAPVSPLVSGAQSGLNFAQKFKQQQLANKMAKTKSQYLPQQLASAIALTQAKTTAVPEQTRIAAQNAATRQNQLAQTINSAPARKIYALVKYYSTPAGQAQLAKNPQLAAQYSQNMKQLTMSLSGSPQQQAQQAVQIHQAAADPQQQAQQVVTPDQSAQVTGAAPSMPSASDLQAQFSSMMQGAPQTDPTAQSGAPQVDPASQQQAAPQPQVGDAGAQGAVDPTYGTTTSPEVLKAVQDAVASHLQKQTNTTGVLNQRTYALSVRNLLNQITPDLPAITKYAGIQGQTGKTLAQLQASANYKTDPDFQKYYTFVNTRGPILANEMKRAFGAASTDTEKKLMEELANPVTWKNNPALATQQFQALADSLAANEQAISKSPAQVQTALSQQAAAPLNMSGPNITVPTFKSKADFQSWYGNLSPTDQAYAKAKIAASHVKSGGR
ncbi:MAG: hypothetical protein ACPG47_00130 [Leucothrix sp.]